MCLSQSAHCIGLFPFPLYKKRHTNEWQYNICKTEDESVSVVEKCHYHGDTLEMQQFLPSPVYTPNAHLHFVIDKPDGLLRNADT